MLKTSPVATVIAEAALITSPVLRGIVQQTITSALENADDTVWTERAACTKDWDALFYGTAMGLLCERADHCRLIHVDVGFCRSKSYHLTEPLWQACKDWFRTHGIVG